MALDVSIVPATREHVETLIRNIRSADVAECEHFGVSPREAVEKGVAQSFWAKAAVRDDGYVYAIWGVGGDLIAEAQNAWLLTANGIEKRAMEFVRTVRKELTAMVREWGAVEAYIDGDYAAALRLFKALGCRFDEPKPLGDGRTFVRIEIGG